MKRWLRWLTGPTPGAFCARLVLLWSPIFAVVVLHPLRVALEQPLTRGYAVLAAKALGGLGVDVVRRGSLILSRDGDIALEIAPVCTGYFLFWMYLGAVLAFPAGWLQRAKGLALGLVLIFALNIVRIVSLYFALGAFPDLFDELHLVVWQGLMIFAVASAWYVWACSGSPRTAAAA